MRRSARNTTHRRKQGSTLWITFKDNALAKLLERMEFCAAPERELPHAISLPEKDVPTILAAIEVRATHLLTGDVRHFRPYFGKNVGGVLICLPGEYLRGQSRA
jgi:hypothetical protein